MPRYSTASASEDSDFVSRLGPPSPAIQQLNSTPRFQLPFEDKHKHDRHHRTGSVDSNGREGAAGDDSEEEEAWDEVDIPQNQDEQQGHRVEATDGDPSTTAGSHKALEIVIGRVGDKHTGPGKKKASTALTPQERQLRQERHKVHVMTLLAMGMVRNNWLNDSELQARLVSQLPPHLHASLVSITREKYPNPRDRSRLFEACLKDLVSWWYQEFDVAAGRELKRKAIQDVETELKSWDRELDALRRREAKGKAKDTGGLSAFSRFPWEEEEQLTPEQRKKRLASQSRKTSQKTSARLFRPFQSSSASWEPVSSIASLYTAAADLRGSKDLSAQLFVALLRGLDIPARLVVSLQGMEWRSDSASGLSKAEAAGKIARNTTGLRAKGKRNTNGTSRKGKGIPIETIEVGSTTSSESDSDDSGWQDGRGKLNYKIPKPNLRKNSSNQKNLAGWKKERMLMKSPSPEPEDLLSPPTQWPEAYSRYLKEWIPLDPTRKLVRCKTKMEPVGKAKGAGNALVYVVGFEEDGSAHDVTPRYAKSYNNSTVKLRVPTSTKAKKDNGGKDWFGTVLEPWQRKYQLNRDKVEEEELWNRSRNEPFPTSFGGFKNHPNYVLEQHLHRDEALIPGTKPLGLFKSTTPVFARSAVLVVKSTENWYRIGRSIVEGAIPRKFVKGRAVTINSKRREELIKLDGGEVDDQPLFSEDQTEIYLPEPVVDGKVPKNSFGNIDLFVPSMLPEGAVHLPSKLAVRCAKMLQIDFAEAIIGFEFRQRRANPTMSGIVVAAEHAETLRQAISNLEEQALEKSLAQQQDRVMKRWKKLIIGLRIRQRLQGQFKDVESGIVGEGATGTSTTASAVGTPRANASASHSPTTTINSSEKPKIARTKTHKRALRRTSTDSSSQLSSELPDGDDDRPPPRKRSARISRQSRITRPSAIDDHAAALEEHSDSSQRATLRVIGPTIKSGVPARNPRPTRASALRAKQNLVLDVDSEEEEAEENQYENRPMIEEAIAPTAQEDNRIEADRPTKHSDRGSDPVRFTETKSQANDETMTVAVEDPENGGEVEEVGEGGDDEYGFEYESE